MSENEKKFELVCLHCKKKIEFLDEIMYAQNAEITYKLNVQSDGQLEYQEQDRISDDPGEFYHVECSIGWDYADLSIEDVEEMLKNGTLKNR